MATVKELRRPSVGGSIETPADLMHEKEVMERYGKLFAERELVDAPQGGRD